MKVRDEAAWQERRAALMADGEIGQSFLTFVTDWAEAAEQMPDHPTYALHDQLRFVEERYGSRISIHYLGQMLAVLAEHWESGPEMMEGLSPIERRLVEDMTLLKVAEVQQQAAEHTNDAYAHAARRLEETPNESAG